MDRRRYVPTVLLLLIVASAHASGQTYRPEDFLPLAVGNSWTYRHEYYDKRHPERNAVMSLTLTLTGSQVVNHHRYYTFGASPYDYPPLPPFAMAGKTVRWSEDGDLMELTPAGEMCFFRFSLPSPYAIAPVDGDTLAYRSAYRTFPFPNHAEFIFSGHPRVGEGRYAYLLEFYGVTTLAVEYSLADYAEEINSLEAVSAVLSGRAISCHDARMRRQTATVNAPWGTLKSGSRLR